VRGYEARIDVTQAPILVAMRGNLLRENAQDSEVREAAPDAIVPRDGSRSKS
jgi:hypothetical protein